MSLAWYCFIFNLDKKKHKQIHDLTQVFNALDGNIGTFMNKKLKRQQTTVWEKLLTSYIIREIFLKDKEHKITRKT